MPSDVTKGKKNTPQTSEEVGPPLELTTSELQKQSRMLSRQLSRDESERLLRRTRHEEDQRLIKAAAELEEEFSDVTAQQAAFLAAYSISANLTRSAMLIGMNSTVRHRTWLKDPVYAAAFLRADEIAKTVLIDEVVRRAIQGVDEPVYRGSGDLVGYTRRYSDYLLANLVKWRFPEFREGPAMKGEINGPNPGQSVQFNVTFVDPPGRDDDPTEHPVS